MNLAPTDFATFARYGIPAELLVAAAVQRVNDHEAKEAFGIQYAGDKSGILFPYFIKDRRVTARVRRDNPDVDSDGKPRNKYVSAWGDNRHVYFPPGFFAMLESDPDAKIVIVEAEKSALAGTAWAKRLSLPYIFLATGGCWGWQGRIGRTESTSGTRVDVKGPLPDLTVCDGRTVYVLLDSNVATNRAVQAAEQALIRELQKRKCRVLTCRIPPVKGVNGPDDLVSVSGDEALQNVLTRANSSPQPTVTWSMPESLGVALPEVPDFEPELLPVALRELAVDTAERMQVPLDFCGVPLVVILAGACNRRAFIRPKRRDPWLVVPNLWGMTVADPGQLKSPTIAALLKPLNRIQRRLSEEYSASVDEHKHAAELAELRTNAWRQQATKEMKAGRSAPERPDEKLVEPTEKRLLINDSTFEKTHQLLSENPAGLLVVRDELAGLFSSFERRGREDERAFYLECWSGDSPFRMDRIGRGSVTVDACCLSLYGAIQPARLRSYLRDALEDGPTNDGLIQRFQLATWPNRVVGWKYIDRVQNESATKSVEEVFERIVSMDPENPVTYQFEPDAQELFIAWLSDLEQTIRDKELAPIMAAHLAKYRSLMPSLALLFALADNVPGTRVPLQHARQAAAFCEYLRPHAERIYACKLSREHLAAIDLAERLVDGWKRDVGNFTLRDLYRRHWAGLATPDEAEAAVDVLEEAGWLKAESTTQTKGRPASETFLINPRIYEGEK